MSGRANLKIFLPEVKFYGPSTGKVLHIWPDPTQSIISGPSVCDFVLSSTVSVGLYGGMIKQSIIAIHWFI